MNIDLSREALAMDVLVVAMVLAVLMLLPVPVHTGVERIVPDTLEQQGTGEGQDDSFPATPEGIRRYMEGGYPYDGPPPPEEKWDPCTVGYWYRLCGGMRGA